MKKVAEFIKDVSENFNGTAALYRMLPAHETYDYCVVSTASAFGVVETYIFGADAWGDIENWGELPGSLKFCNSHKEALEAAGYEMVKK